MLDNHWDSFDEDLPCVWSVVASELDQTILCEKDVSKEPKKRNKYHLRIEDTKAKRINQVTFKFIIAYSKSQRKELKSNNIFVAWIFSSAF